MSGSGVWVAAARALGPLRPGATVAVGGISGVRKPMLLLRELVGSGARDLRIVAFLGGVDVEYLLASQVVAEIHTAGVSLDAAGLAPLFRRARQDGDPRVVEWSEGSLHAALEAAARGYGSLPAPTSPRSDVVAVNPHLKVVADPFSGEDVVAARALVPDLALLHVPFADAAGNAVFAGDPGIDDLLARASKRVVVSVSHRDGQPQGGGALSRIWIDALVHAPEGCWPTACHPTNPGDQGVIRAWAKDPATPARLTAGAHA